MDSLFFKEHYGKISNFFSIGSLDSQSFSLVGIHRSRSEFGALGLVLIISPLSKLGITHRFFMDSLLFKEHFLKISNFFSTVSISSQSFSLDRIHWSRSKFGALGLVLIISPSSDLGIAHHFFMDSILFKENSFKS